jgi:anti-anti-sigma factor
MKPTVFSITDGHVEGICIIAITGWFTLPTAGLFAEIANEHISEGHRFIVVELSGSKHIDSGGMAALVGAFGRIKTRMGELVIAGAKGKTLETFRVSNLDTVLGIFESLDKAVAALSGGEIPFPLRVKFEKRILVKAESVYDPKDHDIERFPAQWSHRAEEPILGHSAVDSARRDEFEECPKCGVCYDCGTVQCLRDNVRLARVISPRFLAGRYLLEQKVGQGGMGSVYVAEDRTLLRRVAVKIIREELVESTQAADRFRREARVAASFTHPNVVTVHDFSMAGTHAFLVMELLEGRSLREALLNQKRFGTKAALLILRDICAALEAAHLRRLVHRDLKPENIFLVARDSREVAKLLDFGIAKLLASDTGELTTETAFGVVLGTPRYMSPEQSHGGEAQPAWDLWGLAVVAYELLTGEYPFDAGDVTRFTPVTQHLHEAPRRLQQFFEHAFILDPARRPQSAQMFFLELQSALRVFGAAT